MNDGQLKEKDAQADEAIANWSLGAVVANILPPPFAEKALKVVFGKIVEDLSHIYGKEAPQPQEVGSVTRGVIQYCKSEEGSDQNGRDHLKYIPGVNVWMALAIQPQTMSAAAHSVGEAFKQYFHAQLDNRQLSLVEVENVAKQSLRTRLHHAVEGTEFKTY
jgi:uncharacterized protein (DUF697 family)